MLDRLAPQSPDALLALIKQFAADPRPTKIDLGVGVYRTATGATPVFRAIKEAERRLLAEQDSKAYLGPEGDLAFTDALVPYIFGSAMPADRIGAMQTPGGTGAVRLAAALAARAGAGRILLGQPSWPNHAQILDDLGIEAVAFDHAASDGTADAEALIAAITSGTADAVLLHGGCHNPTGIDYTPAQWDEIAAALAATGTLPILDIAYHGLGQGMDADVAGVRTVLAAVPQALVAYSCDKNFGLYRDRVGAFYVVMAEPGALASVMSNAAALARATWSMPPDHGAAAVRIVLEDATLTADWLDELASMRARMRGVRAQLAAADAAAPGLGLAALAGQNGLFAMLPLNAEQIERLRDEYGVYMAGSGRINIAGLHDGNIARFLEGLAAVSGGGSGDQAAA